MSKTYISKVLRRSVEERANGCCEYCQSQQKYSHDLFCIDHILPESKGGMTQFDNLALSCQTCNLFKHDKIESADPITQTMVILYHPRLHEWQQHFIWNEDFTLVLGISSIGRATVETLRLNRSGIVAYRAILSAAGLHPPE